ncbi:hypothetical protein ACIQ8P_13015 [Bacillus tropicus]
MTTVKTNSPNHAFQVALDESPTLHQSQLLRHNLEHFAQSLSI